MESSHDVDLIGRVHHYLKYVYIALVIIGFIGNCLNILVFTNRRLFHRNPSAFYLTIESLFNIGALIHTCIERLTQYSNGSDLADYSLIWCKLDWIFDHLFTLVCFSIICCAAFDQILSTNHQLTIRQLSTFKLTQYLIAFSIILALIHCLLPIVFFEIISPIGCLPKSADLIKYYLYFYYPILVGILPICLSSIFSLLAYRNVRRLVRRQVSVVRRRLDRQITAIILARIILFVLSQLPYIIYRLFTIVKLLNGNSDIPFLFNQLMQTTVVFIKHVNYAMTSYLFLVVSSRFRRQARFLLLKKLRRQMQITPN